MRTLMCSFFAIIYSDPHRRLDRTMQLHNFYNTCIVPAIHQSNTQQSQSVCLSFISFFLSSSNLPLKRVLSIVEERIITHGETKEGEKTGLFFVDDRDTSYCNIVLHVQRDYKT
jgi:hypothetical protein